MTHETFVIELKKKILQVKKVNKDDINRLNEEKKFFVQSVNPGQ